MIWSFVKFALFFAIVVGLALGASYVMDTGGNVIVAFGSTEVSVTPIQALLFLVVVFVALFVLLKLAGFLVACLRWVNGNDNALDRYFNRKREKRGYQALGDSVIALAAGDGKTAMAKAAKADKYIGRPELTALVNAQAAQITGDTKGAEEHYKTLLTDDRTRFVGVQGLLRQKLDTGDTGTALALAEKAFAINPRHDPTLETLFKLQSDKRDWSGARKTLQARVHARALPGDVGQRRDAVLSLADAASELEAGNAAEAKARVAKAMKIAPGLIPAATLQARLMAEDGEKRRATSVLKKAWKLAPHPDLASSFAAIEPEEEPLARIKRFKPLLKILPEHAETRMLEAELYLAAEDFPAARKAIGTLAETDPTARSLSIMAAVERGSGAEEAVVSGWLARALSAPRGDAWICESCNHIHNDWGPTCDNCESFDTMTWSRVPVSDDAKTMAAAMLPLLVRPAGDGTEDEAVVVSDDAAEAAEDAAETVIDAAKDVAEDVVTGREANA